MLCHYIDYPLFHVFIKYADCLVCVHLYPIFTDKITYLYTFVNRSPLLSWVEFRTANSCCTNEY